MDSKEDAIKNNRTCNYCKYIDRTYVPSPILGYLGDGPIGTCHRLPPTAAVCAYGSVGSKSFPVMLASDYCYCFKRKTE